MRLLLSPGVNLKRNPLCGRSFEYFSEGSYLTGRLAAGFIRGAAARGVDTSLTHLAVNSQERIRFHSDSILDERTLRDRYLTAFEIVVKEGKPSTVMCAYPKLNGMHSSGNPTLLTQLLGRNGALTAWPRPTVGAMNDASRASASGVI